MQKVSEPVEVLRSLQHIIVSTMSTVRLESVATAEPMDQQ